MRNIIKNILKEEVNPKSERVKSMVKKFGLEQAIEMIVGGMDTIVQAYKDNPLEFLDQFNDLTIVETGDITYYLDEDRTTIFYIESGQDKININPRKVWDFFWVGMKYSYNEIRNIMVNWLKEKHGITGLTPFIGHEYYSNRFK
jgi:hypothetical protein